jgi:hypothetical protein
MKMSQKKKDVYYRLMERKDCENNKNELRNEKEKTIKI